MFLDWEGGKEVNGVFLFVVGHVVFVFCVNGCLGGRDADSGQTCEEYGRVAERKDVSFNCFGPELASIF